MDESPKATAIQPGPVPGSADDSLKRTTLVKVTLRLIPFLFLLYVVNILDRTNVNFARLTMLRDLGMRETVYGLAAGLFYVGYCFFQVPSNLLLRRTGARRTIAGILISWGLVSCATMFVRGPGSFYLLRILLGFAQAGFFPGVILFLTFWFPARERARAVAWFMIGSPVTGIVGYPLSGVILDNLNGTAGLHGWQWLFLIEGAPAVLLGFVVLWYLTDRPEQAAWLSPGEQSWLVGELAREERGCAQRHGLTLGQAMADGRVWLLALLYFTVAAGANGLGLYLPKLIEERAPGRSNFEIGLFAAIPNVVAAVCMVCNGWHSDRTGERRYHVAVPAFVAAVGWALAGCFDSLSVGLVALTLAQAAMMSMLPTFWTLPAAFLSGAAAAAGIALINAVGNLGGFAAPNVLSPLKDLTGSFTPGLLIMAATMAVGGVLALCVRHDRAAEGKAA